MSDAQDVLKGARHSSAAHDAPPEPSAPLRPGWRAPIGGSGKQDGLLFTEEQSAPPGAARFEIDVTFQGEAAAPIGADDQFGLLDQQAAQQGTPAGSDGIFERIRQI